MKQLTLLFILTIQISSYSQSSKFEIDLFISGNIRNNTSKPVINNKFSLLTDITYRVNDKFSTGLGFEYGYIDQKAIKPIEAKLNESGGKTILKNEKQYLSSNTFNIKSVNRFHGKLNSKLNFIAGLDVGYFRSIAEHVHFTDNGIMNFNTITPGILIQHYAGFNYQLNNNLSLKIYSDVLHIKAGVERADDMRQSKSVSEILFVSFTDLNMLKFGAAWRI